MFKVKEYLYILLMTVLILLANGIFSIGYEKNQLDAPSISNKSALAYELSGKNRSVPEYWIDQWAFAQSPPFRYRLLGKLPIIATYKLLSQFCENILDAFYYSFLAWTGIYLYFFLLAAGRLTVEFISSHGLSEKQNRLRIFCLASTLLALSPPLLYAFKFPVHGNPNDILGYLLIALSLLSLIRDDLPGFVINTVLGIFCRETNLIVLLPLLFMTDIKVSKRIGIVALIGSIFSLYRLCWPGHYNPLGGAAHNLEYPIESLLFLFMVFGPFWLLGWLGYNGAKNIRLQTNGYVRAVASTFYLTPVIVTAIVFFLARVREIRIEFILFFYFIPYSVIYLMNNWQSWLRIIPSYRFALAMLAVAVLNFHLFAFLMPPNPAFPDTLIHFFGYYGGGWYLNFIPYLASTMTVLVLIIFKHSTKCSAYSRS